MAQSGKSSGKRGKPSYFMSILGVTLVLFLLGLIGWLVINANKLGRLFQGKYRSRSLPPWRRQFQRQRRTDGLYFCKALCKRN